MIPIRRYAESLNKKRYILENGDDDEMQPKISLSSGRKEDLQLKLMEFFKNNPNATDDAIHDFAEKERINPHQFEEVIYSLLGAILGKGKFVESGAVEGDFDHMQIKRGIEVEMEHTSNPAVAKRIALDHLAEIPDYYTRLDKMEKEAGVEH